MVVDADMKALLSFQILAEIRINLAPMELRSGLNIGRYTKPRKEIRNLMKNILNSSCTSHILVPTPVVYASVR